MKIKQFVSKHKIGLSVVAGALTGSAFGVLAKIKLDRDNNEIVNIYMTPHQAGLLISEAGGHIRYDTPAGRIHVSIEDD
ncbi:hypothetical protein SEA_PHEROBRINE_42 [Gordonia phage Pherobrine]|jgi:hypothetical protein|nr:hypothetical protein SEA_PHEROBRINE_42 [Gordonia phage Pherobrine]